MANELPVEIHSHPTASHGLGGADLHQAIRCKLATAESGTPRSIVSLLGDVTENFPHLTAYVYRHGKPVHILTPCCDEAIESAKSP